MIPRLSSLGAALLAAGGAAFGAGSPVKFSRTILPILRQNCVMCHTGPAAPGGFHMETAAKLLAGGRHGAAVLPGKSADSTIVKYLTGVIQPQMPPGKPLTLDTIALVRRWIDEGAKIDAMAAPTEGVAGNAPAKPAPASSLADLPVRVQQSAPIAALAYSPDGRLLAAGGFRKVWLFDTATGALARALSGPADQVLSLAWSSDGSTLAAAGGVAGAYGEVCLWNAARWGAPRIAQEHSDTIYGIAWRPGGHEFATASLDKTVKIWDPASLRTVKILKDHVDAVFCVAYSPDGKWLSTGSSDRSVKIYSTADYSHSAANLPHPDGVTSVAFSAKSDLLATACADKNVRVWPVKPGAMDNPLRSESEGETVDSVAFGADGSEMAWGAANHTVRAWSGDGSSRKWSSTEPTDWVYAVAIRPDGQVVAAGSGDGRIYFYNGKDGKPIRSVSPEDGLSSSGVPKNPAVPGLPARIGPAAGAKASVK